MRPTLFLLTLLLGAAAPAIASADALPPAPARPPPGDAARLEAHDRFERALRLFNDNDNAAALAEFQRVYELVPNPTVLYNIGLVYAAMGRPVEAADTFDKLLAAPGALAAEQRARATTLRAAQADRVASLVVKANVEGATIEVDNLEAARTPLGAPLRVASGTHVVAVVAPGYAPLRKAVTVAGRSQAEVAFDLAPMQGRLAHLTVRSHLPEAEVVVDGQVAGKTPLPGSLTLAPGRHRIEVRRAGYLTVRQDLALGDASAGEIAFEPEEDAVLAASDGTLALDLRETDAVVTVDGRLRGAYSVALHLPVGLHHLRIERSGFFALERDVTVASGAPTHLRADLEPTPDTLAVYTQRIRSRRTLGWAGAIGGAALTAGGVAILAYDAGQRSSARSQHDTLAAALSAHQHPCDFSHGDDPQSCIPQINAAAARYNATLGPDAVGYVLGGVGVAALATGVVLLVTGDDPHRYDRKPSDERWAGPRVTPAAWGTFEGGGLGVTGSF